MIACLAKKKNKKIKNKKIKNKKLNRLNKMPS